MKRLTRKKQNEIINLVFENNKIMKNLYITTDGVDKRLKDKYDENSEEIVRLIGGHGALTQFYEKMINYLEGRKNDYNCY